MEKKDVSQLKKMIGWLGFHLTNGRWGIMVFLYIILMIVLITNSLFVIIKHEEVDQKLDGLKALVLYLMCFMYFVALALDWDDQMLLIKTMDEGLFKASYPTTVRHAELKKTILDEISQINSIWFYGLNAYISMVVITPVLFFIYRYIENNMTFVPIDKLYLSLPFYFPENYNTLPVFVIAFLLQSMFFVYGINNGYLALASSFNSMQMVEGELKLLRQSLIDMDDVMKTTQFSETASNSFTDMEDAVRLFLKYFVRHHLEIFRKVDEVSKGIQFVGISVNSLMAVLLCTAIYRVVTRNDLIVLVQEVIYGSILMFCLYCYGSSGEKVSNADEELSKALYEYPWTDKPQWFKKYLQIIMARTNRTIEMKSLGLFTLDLRNFILKLRAAYSYFNVLYSLK